ncbi:MAM and LDL-receptor class A domain-containing protein 1-like isoform X2 [Acropora muricata]|uniref:MAM and LDL-receptor class A domain-containing protein 1-like isoform X2 n=1 Tax=Acropora muricata TaxID=159855 RepID=UPI0034E4F4C6
MSILQKHFACNGLSLKGRQASDFQFELRQVLGNIKERFNMKLALIAIAIIIPGVLGAFNHNCDFENGLCPGWYQSKADDFDWTLHSGSTRTSNTGPSSGHGGSGFYMYIEASSQRAADHAKLVFSPPSVAIGKWSCLKFYYHMHGVHILRLNVLNRNCIVFTRSGQQGNMWMYAEVAVFVQNNITFEGICDYGTLGDIAIDDVSLMEGICAADTTLSPSTTRVVTQTTRQRLHTSATPVLIFPDLLDAYSLNCDFENGLCPGWYQSKADDFDWTLHSGSTRTSNTGPSSGHGGSGSYMYIEVSYQRAGDHAKLIFSPPSLAIGKLSCLKFYYHMYGGGVIRLNVFNRNCVVFTKSGQQGDMWMYAEVAVFVQNNITFEAISGHGYLGDIAIDDVSLMEGICAADTTLPPSTIQVLTQTTTQRLTPVITISSKSVTPNTTTSYAIDATAYAASSVDTCATTSSTTSATTTGQMAIDVTPESPYSSIAYNPTSAEPSDAAIKEAVMVIVDGLDVNEWDQRMENGFKAEVARTATQYCNAEQAKCLTSSARSRRRRSSDMVFSPNMVHILPGYPKRSPEDPKVAMIAFYLNLPPEVSQGTVLSKYILTTVIKSNMPSIGRSMNGCPCRCCCPFDVLREK